MNEPWYIRLAWWLCEKTGHLRYHGWVYNKQYHRDCKLCGRIVSVDIKKEG